MSGDLRGLVTAFALSHVTMRNIRENLFWAFGYRGCPHGPADTHTDQPSSTRKDAHMEAVAFAFMPGRAGSAAR